jgi:monothiol glutaredoxin
MTPMRHVTLRGLTATTQGGHTRAFSVSQKPAAIPAHIKTAIESTLSKHAVVLFMKGNPDQPMYAAHTAVGVNDGRCGFSRFAVQVLDLYGANFTAVDILKDGELRDWVKVYSDWPTFPQLFVQGDLVGGADIMRVCWCFVVTMMLTCV